MPYSWLFPKGLRLQTPTPNSSKKKPLHHGMKTKKIYTT